MKRIAVYNVSNLEPVKELAGKRYRNRWEDFLFKNNNVCVYIPNADGGMSVSTYNTEEELNFLKKRDSNFEFMSITEYKLMMFLGIL